VTTVWHNPEELPGHRSGPTPFTISSVANLCQVEFVPLISS